MKFPIDTEGFISPIVIDKTREEICKECIVRPCCSKWCSPAHKRLQYLLFGKKDKKGP
jgi:sulfatase maturation enzyme AslB (radical SAM superfamily)